jgi:hypothetical protein
MSNLRSFQRHLKPEQVHLANQVSTEKLKIARQVVLDRVKKDAEFAADVLKAVGDSLPKEIKEACEKSVKNRLNPEDTIHGKKITREEALSGLDLIVGDDLTPTMVPVQTDGGGKTLVHETELLDYPTDGPNSAEPKLPVFEAFDTYPKDSKVKGW